MALVDKELSIASTRLAYRGHAAALRTEIHQLRVNSAAAGHAEVSSAGTPQASPPSLGPCLEKPPPGDRSRTGRPRSDRVHQRPKRSRRAVRDGAGRVLRHRAASRGCAGLRPGRIGQVSLRPVLALHAETPKSQRSSCGRALQRRHLQRPRRPRQSFRQQRCFPVWPVAAPS